METSVLWTVLDSVDSDSAVRGDPIFDSECVSLRVPKRHPPGFLVCDRLGDCREVKGCSYKLNKTSWEAVRERPEVGAGRGERRGPT